MTGAAVGGRRRAALLILWLVYAGPLAGQDDAAFEAVLSLTRSGTTQPLGRGVRLESGDYLDFDRLGGTGAAVWLAWRPAGAAWAVSGAVRALKDPGTTARWECGRVGRPCPSLLVETPVTARLAAAAVTAVGYLFRAPDLALFAGGGVGARHLTLDWATRGNQVVGGSDRQLDASLILRTGAAWKWLGVGFRADAWDEISWFGPRQRRVHDLSLAVGVVLLGF